ncbi:DUF6787 family protein [Myroides sp. LJL119]
MEKLKKRWGLNSNFQAVIILIVFAITGSTSAFISKPILSYIGIERGLMHPVPYWILYVILIMPVYKVMLISIGTVFGQRTFFVNFVRKMLTRMKLGFLMPQAKQTQVIKQRVKN